MLKLSSKFAKVALYGGTFDPIHQGHLEVATTIKNKYQLDQVIFIPSFRHPHKQDFITPFKKRVAMLTLALACYPQFSISELESERLQASYTIDTILAFQDQNFRGKFYFIIGADVLLELHLWHRFQDILKSIELIVAARPDYPLRLLHKAVSNFHLDLAWHKAQNYWSNHRGSKIHYVPSLAKNISSRAIRHTIKQNQTLQTLVVPKNVANYIQGQDLYQKK